MSANSREKIQLSQLIESLAQLSVRADDSNHGKHFQRLTLNHRVLTRLQADIYNRELTKKDIGSGEFLMITRGAVFNWASLESSLNFYRWSRTATVQELASQSHRSASEYSILMSIMALRSIIEIAGNVSLMGKDLDALAEPGGDEIALMNWLNEFESIIDARISGVRVDYSVLTNSGLREAKKYSYKPSEFEVDQTSRDLLKGIDLLDKRVKGARAAYEFFSEFAHPNLASVWTHYDRTEMKMKVLDIHCYAVHHQRKHIGAMFLDTFGHLLSEGILITQECVEELRRLDVVFKSKSEILAKQAKRAIRQIIKRNPQAFDSREWCPCGSGNNILQCCGKLIKSSNFGRFAKVGSLN